MKQHSVPQERENKKYSPNTPAGPNTLAEDAQLLESAIKEAGHIALQYFQEPTLKIWHKKNNTPICQGDVAIDQFLKKALLKNRPDYGWLSEETIDDESRLPLKRLWIVDPIDGTAAYIKGQEDWCVSIALIEDNRPVLGAIYAPAAKDFYCAQKGKGSFLNGQKIRASNTQNLEQARMTGNIQEIRSSDLWPMMWPSGMEVCYLNSIALRIAHVASGHADICVTLRPKNDWDIAAADLIIHEAGGALTTTSNDTLRYNQDLPLHGHIIASAPQLHSQALEIITTALTAKKGS